MNEENLKLERDILHYSTTSECKVYLVESDTQYIIYKTLPKKVFLTIFAIL